MSDHVLNMNKTNPLRVFVDMDDTICRYTQAKEYALAQFPGNPFPQSQMDFFRQLKPIAGAVESLRWMLSHDSFDPHILSAPSELNPLCYTEKRLWISDHLGSEWVDRLHISAHKGFFKGDILIDDYCEGKGQEHFEGTLIQFGSQDFPSWVEVRNELIVRFAS